MHPELHACILNCMDASRAQAVQRRADKPEDFVTKLRVTWSVTRLSRVDFALNERGGNDLAGVIAPVPISSHVTCAHLKSSSCDTHSINLVWTCRMHIPHAHTVCTFRKHMPHARATCTYHICMHACIITARASHPAPTHHL